MNIHYRDLIEQMELVDNLVVLFQDYNNKWFLMGETLGCSVEWDWKSDVRNGRNTSSVNFLCRERYPIRNVDISFVENYILGTLIKDLNKLTYAEINSMTYAEINKAIYN